FIVENRPGSGNNIGTEAVVRSAPDGYTLLIASSSNTINASLYDKLNFVFLRDIAAVAGIISLPFVMVVNPLVPAKTVPEFIAYAKMNPGKISFRVARHRNSRPCERRAVQHDGRCQNDSRTVSRRGRRGDRFAWRTGAGLVRHHVIDG